MPVEVTQTAWHFTTGLDLFDHWQTVIAGVLALAAAFGTVVATMIIARKQIAVAQKQIDTTLRLEQERVASEATAFRAMLEAAMVRVLSEVAWAKETYPQLMKQDAGQSPQALIVRNSITRGAFAELRAASVGQGSPLTGEFLDLEREIENLAMQWVDIKTTEGAVIRHGMHARLGEQLDVIENKATELRKKAAEN